MTRTGRTARGPTRIGRTARGPTRAGRAARGPRPDPDRPTGQAARRRPVVPQPAGQSVEIALRLSCTSVSDCFAASDVALPVLRNASA